MEYEKTKFFSGQKCSNCSLSIKEGYRLKTWGVSEILCEICKKHVGHLYQEMFNIFRKCAPSKATLPLLLLPFGGSIRASIYGRNLASHDKELNKIHKEIKKINNSLNIPDLKK